jgi:hypothetical protein
MPTAVPNKSRRLIARRADLFTNSAVPMSVIVRIADSTPTSRDVSDIAVMFALLGKRHLAKISKRALIGFNDGSCTEITAVFEREIHLRMIAT